MSTSLRTVNGEEYRFGEELLPIACFRCGVCCVGYYPQLPPEELEAMAKHLAISTAEFVSRYVEVTRIGYLLRQTADGCVILNWARGRLRASCSVYPFRPSACRNWKPGLLRRECQQGLAQLQEADRLLLVSEVYRSPEEVERFCRLLRQP